MDDREDPMAPQLNVVTESLGNGTRVVALRGELDVATVPSLDEALSVAVRVEGTPKLLLDLSEVTFIDSTALMRLLTAQRELDRRGGQMVLVCSNPTVLRLFEVTRTNETFEIFPTRDRALGSLEPA
jgi:anti-sigma B factor antagonist